MAFDEHKPIGASLKVQLQDFEGMKHPQLQVKLQAEMYRLVLSSVFNRAAGQHSMAGKQVPATTQRAGEGWQGCRECLVTVFLQHCQFLLHMGMETA